MNRDYRPIPALDRYDGDVLDEDDYDNMSPGARAAAERELQRRDLEEGTGRRDADGILYGSYNLRFLAILYDLILCFIQMNMMMTRHLEKNDEWLKELLLVLLLMMSKMRKYELEILVYFMGHFVNVKHFIINTCLLVYLSIAQLSLK